MGQVTINGKTYQGNSVSVIDNRVYIDGKLVEIDGKPAKSLKSRVFGKDDRYLEVRVEGELMSLTSDLSVTCQNVTGDVKSGGSVSADDIRGNVDARGSVNADDIGGSVNAGGSVNCDDIGGSVRAGGSINRS